MSLAESSEIGSISLLLFLYVLQGIPLGLSASIPMILQNRGVSYKEQVRATAIASYVSNSSYLTFERIFLS